MNQVGRVGHRKSSNFEDQISLSMPRAYLLDSVSVARTCSLTKSPLIPKTNDLIDFSLLLGFSDGLSVSFKYIA